jgi:hypothetical protein
MLVLFGNPAFGEDFDIYKRGDLLPEFNVRDGNVFKRGDLVPSVRIDQNGNIYEIFFVHTFL